MTDDLIILSPRETVLVRLIGEGFTIDDIAARYDLSRWTVRDRARRVCGKLGCAMADIPARHAELAAAGRIYQPPPRRE